MYAEKFKKEQRQRDLKSKFDEEATKECTFEPNINEDENARK